jgi:hypothetical protein
MSNTYELNSKTVSALNTFRATAAKGLNANGFFAAGIADEYKVCMAAGKESTGAFKRALVKASIAADKADAKAADTPFGDWPVSRHAKVANLEKDLKVYVTRFLGNEEYEALGFEPTGAGLLKLLKDESLVNGVLWDRFYYKKTAAGKVTATKNRKAKQAKVAAKKAKLVTQTIEGTDAPSTRSPAELVAMFLIQMAKGGDVDVTELYEETGNVIEDFLASISDEKAAAVNG